MNLLTEKELVWSAVVANNRMNRERRASGVNSYEKELGFKPEELLKEYIHHCGEVKWLDLCCGRGNALVQCAEHLAKYDLQGRSVLKGVDLINGFQVIPFNLTCLKWETGSIVGWIPDCQYDLITCVHGLHYVGDKLGVIEKMCGALSKNGRFIANIDWDNVKAPENGYIKDILIRHNVAYDQRRKILTCQGTRKLDFGLVYMGASDQAGPNYTGQEAVDSYYRLR